MQQEILFKIYLAVLLFSIKLFRTTLIRVPVSQRAAVYGHHLNSGDAGRDHLLFSRKESALRRGLLKNRACRRHRAGVGEH